MSEVQPCRVGIVGGAGYTAGELIRILLNHPHARLAWVHSSSNAGALLEEVHGGIAGETPMRFTDTIDLKSIDVLFLCQAHGKSREFWEQNVRPDTLKVVDLAQDYRDESDGYVYGLTCINADRAAAAMSVANPGCFATAIQLALLPAAQCGALDYKEVHVTGITGSTGAGVKPGATTHYSWRADNLSVYKPFTHQHLDEVTRTLQEEGSPAVGQPVFIPMRGPFQRGIFVTAVFDMRHEEARLDLYHDYEDDDDYEDCEYRNRPVTIDELPDIYRQYYAGDPFVQVTDREIDLKQVTGTNKAVINVTTCGDRVLVTCAIDNLLKGASGQAVENMNLMMGYTRNCGLRLKATAF